MTDEEKWRLSRSTDENGNEICGEYLDPFTLKFLPSYCTEEELEKEKRDQAKKSNQPQ